MKRAEELTVIGKMYDFRLWSCNHTSRFPRNHRFVLGERIEGNVGFRVASTLRRTLESAKPESAE